ncbi:phage neck terminator protein [Brevibacillus laterosporus]|uniref:phage neck terminator protein n=1 Tax=Brevibacillus laterosporus TaxID=1465 RepID=UPI000839C638|nr:hypothetical protein [Brevibacillus laterosporus]
MINYKQFEQNVITGMAKALGIKVIAADGSGDQPPYPFMTYKYVTPYKDKSPMPIEKYVPTADMLEVHAQKQVEMTLSFTCCHKDQREALQIANQSRQWLVGQARQGLRDNGIVVVSAGDTQERHALFEFAYEYRAGYDVKFRVIDSFTYTHSEWIEKMKISEEGIPDGVRRR